MADKDKKLAVFLAVKRAKKPISISEVLTYLGDEYSERSVRRWLSELAQEGKLIRSGKKRSTRYHCPGTSPVLPEFSFSADSQAALKRICQPKIKRDPVTYHIDWLEQYTPNQTFYFSEKQRARLLKIGQRELEHQSAGTFAHKIYNRLLIDLSHNSSRLEGNTYSLLDTEKLIIEGKEPTGKSDEEKIMILNHREAIRHLIDSATTIDISTQEIFTLHYLLSDGLVASEYSGKIRNTGVMVKGSTYVPFENKTKLKNLLESICEKAAQIKDPFETSFFLLVHISYLQAFIDVNKRTARLSANIPLIKGNLVPLSFNDIDQQDYLNAVIAIYELNDVNPLADLVMFSYERTCKQYDIQAIAIGIDPIRVQYRQERRDVLRKIIEQGLKGKPMEAFIQTQAAQLIPKKNRPHFIENLHEDIENLAPQTIVGLGITIDQLKDWQAKC